mgnify:CR=1 FL=1
MIYLRESKPTIPSDKIKTVDGSGTDVMLPELFVFISIVEYSALALLLR